MEENVSVWFLFNNCGGGGQRDLRSITSFLIYFTVFFSVHFNFDPLSYKLTPGSHKSPFSASLLRIKNVIGNDVHDMCVLIITK